MHNIEALIPHREPFLFVDRIVKAEEDEIIGYKLFKESEFFFKGHFPQYPIVPGVILVESMAQCGGAGISKQGILKDALFFLATVQKAKFRNQVRPGDEIKMVIKNLRISKVAIKQAGKAYLGEKIAAEAEWMCIVGKKEQLT